MPNTKTMEERANIIASVIIEESMHSIAKHYSDNIIASGVKPSKAEISEAIDTNWEKILNEIMDTADGVTESLFI